MPSAVAVNLRTGQAVCGEEAWAHRTALAADGEYISSIKRRLGTDWSLQTPQGILNPAAVAGLLFSRLQDLVHQRTGGRIGEAVVAIPVGFEAEKRRQLREAAEMAGFRISSFVSEPTAAFFANYRLLRNAHHIAVFDWGGGTLDVSILRHEHGAIHEEATVGLDKAGSDIDEMLARHVHSIFCSTHGIHAAFEEMEPQAQDQLQVRCEKAKREFTDSDSVLVQLNNYGGLGPCRVPLEYGTFSELISPLVEDAARCLKLAVREAGLELSALDAVLMTGGSSNLRTVRERLRDLLPVRPIHPGETAWHVADGATALAASPGTYRAGQDIGIRLSDDSYFGLLREGECLEGWRQSCTFGLVDDTEQARIVFSGSPDIDADERSRITLPFPAYNFMQETLRLDAEVDDDHVFRVTATSNMQPDSIRRVWEYTRLKRYYEIPTEVRRND